MNLFRRLRWWRWGDNQSFWIAFGEHLQQIEKTASVNEIYLWQRYLFYCCKGGDNQYLPEPLSADDDYDDGDDGDDDSGDENDDEDDTGDGAESIDEDRGGEASESSESCLRWYFL